MALKAALRQEVLARRDALGPERRARLSAAIFARVAALEAFRRSGTILAYCSFGSEPVTDPFLDAVRAGGKTLVLPRVDRASRSLELFRVEEPGRQLGPGMRGIREPLPDRCVAVPLREVAFVLVPGVAFDATGGRLGHGGGYYDRLLARCDHRPPLVAAAFEVQMVEAVPMGPDDRRVDRVVTERGLYPAGAGAGPA